MSIEIIECTQGEDAWHQARLGIPTSSKFHTVLARGVKGGESLTRREYLYKLAGEIITGEPMNNFVSKDMERGKVMEEEARDYYALITRQELRRVGFIRNGAKGCSPDSLIGSNGAVEFKTAFPHILGELIDRDEFPPNHKAQTQGVLWVAELEWIDLSIFWPKMPRFIKRAVRDEPYIRNLESEVDRFNADLHEIVERIRRYGTERAAA